MKIFKMSGAAVVLLFCFVCLGFGTMSDEEAIGKFVAGNNFYREGKFKEAAQKYTEVLEAGKESSVLYYNLGNAFFKDGQLGKALINYERAMRLTPRDHDLRFNYNHVLSYTKNPAAEVEKNMLIRILNDFVYFYSQDEMVGILNILLGIFIVIHMLSMFLNWSTALQRNLLSSIFIIMVIFGIGLLTKIDQEREKAIVVKNTEAKFEPKEDSTAHFRLPEGVKIRIMAEENDWAKIQRSDGKVGWVGSGDFEKI